MSRLTVGSSVAIAAARFAFGGVMVLLLALALVAGLLAAVEGPDSHVCEMAPTEAVCGWSVRAATMFNGGLTFRLGRSQSGGERVMDMVKRSIWASLGLVGSGITLTLAAGVGLAVGSAVRPESQLLGATSTVVAGVSNVPVLVWAMAVLWLQSTQDVALVNFTPAGTWEWLVLYGAPVLALVFGDGMLGDLIRRVRIEADAVLSEPYMRTVRALGFGVKRQLLRSVTPVVADLIASRALFLVGAAIVVEWVFGIRGVGFLVVDSLVAPQGRSPMAVVGASMAIVSMAVGLRLAAEVWSVSADPRRSRVVTTGAAEDL